MSQIFENVKFLLDEVISFWEVDYYNWNNKGDNCIYTSFHDLWVYQNSWEFSGGWSHEIIRNAKHFHNIHVAGEKLTRQQCRDNPWHNFLPTLPENGFNPKYIKEHGYVVFAAGSRRKMPPSREYNFQFFDLNDSAQAAERRISIAFNFCFAKAIPVKLLAEAYWKQRFSPDKRLKFIIVDNNLQII